MSTHTTLELLLKDILCEIKPSSHDRSVRNDIVDQLQDIVRDAIGLRGATVAPYGSFLSNLYTPWGDLDISIDLEGADEQKILHHVFRALREKEGFNRVQLVPSRRVPVVKFKTSKISCDISVNNLSGQMKSKFLYWISDIDPRFRDLVLLVKEWAKSQNINDPTNGTFNSYSLTLLDPTNGTFNSYSLTLLVIFHFQTCVPAILPPLSEIYPRNLAKGGQKSVLLQPFKQECTANITRFKGMRRGINESSLSELFISFLAKFCEIEERAKVQKISTFTGKWEDVDINKRLLRNTQPLIIEDPVERPENTGRTVKAGNLKKICGIFKETHQQLTSIYQTRNSLIPKLVGSHVRPLIRPQNQGVSYDYLNTESYYQVGASRSSHQLTMGNSSMPEQINRFNEAPLYPWSTQPDRDFYQSSCTPSGSSTGQVSEVQEKKSGWLTGAVSVLAGAAAVAAAVAGVSAILMDDEDKEKSARGQASSQGGTPAIRRTRPTYD